MKKLLPILAAAGLFVIGCNGDKAEGALVVINGEQVPMEDYYKQLELLTKVNVVVDPRTLRVDRETNSVPVQVQSYDVRPSLGFQALNAVIRQRILKQMAIDQGAWPSKEDVDAEIKFREKQNPEYLKQIRSAGLSLDQLKQALAIELAREKLLTNKATVSSEDVEKYIKENPAQFTQPESARILWIVAENAQKRDLADADLKSGQMFAIVASRYSVAPNARTTNHTYPETVVDRMPVRMQQLVRKTAEFKQTEWEKGADGRWYKFYIDKKEPKKLRQLTPEQKEMVRRELAMREGSQGLDLSKRLLDKLKKSKIEVQYEPLKEAWNKEWEEMMANTAKEADSSVQSAPKAEGTQVPGQQ